MNNITFNGKAEVLYGLKQAAANARSAEFWRLASGGPHPVDKSTQEAIFKSKASAYADMAVFDKSFYKTIGEISPKDAASLNLGTQICQNGIIKPMLVFSEAILEAVKKHGNINSEGLKQFFDKIPL